jgi:predicted HAD superfamily Cof-like phosphohydrolase
VTDKSNAELIADARRHYETAANDAYNGQAEYLDSKIGKVFQHADYTEAHEFAIMMSWAISDVLLLADRLEALTEGPKASQTMRDLEQFHETFDLPVRSTPYGHVDPELAALRVELMREECQELSDAVAECDIVEIADALGDIVYVAYGNALTYGIDLDAVLREVHRSNMTKIGADGQVLRRADGKILKPDTFSPPDIKRVLREQRPLLEMDTA